jgi:hypothetical protein
MKFRVFAVGYASWWLVMLAWGHGYARYAAVALSAMVWVTWLALCYWEEFSQNQYYDPSLRTMPVVVSFSVCAVAVVAVAALVLLGGA